MKRLLENKHARLMFMIFIVGALLIIFNQIVGNYESFSEGVGTIKTIISPFIYGFVMAYLLSPIYNATVRGLYKLLGKYFKNKQRLFSFCKLVASVVAVVCLIGAVAGLIALIVPQVIESLTGILKSLPQRLTQLSALFNDITSKMDNKRLAMKMSEIYAQVQTNLIELAQTKLLPGMGTLVGQVSTQVILTLKTMMNVMIGVMACVYMLNSKERFQGQFKKVILATLPKEKAEAVFDFAKFTNRTFGGFINGKIIDSIIIGIICFILMKIFGFPYPILISAIIGITNVIPFFGPFIGAIPAAIIILLVSPIHALYFLILIFILQQVDGNIIGPAILGNTTGIASFWVLFSIVIGGGLFGFIGMVLGVPVFAIIYYYFSRSINKRLEAKGLEFRTDSYEDLNKYKIDKEELR
ncbi:MAG: AI-2E family transporter [[Eubacterium] sulci]|nr:AI-2E family transporter [[Eubacterium] sulci]MBF1181912.1 AI-2E family transporter [[Eubacterium] sulci]